MATKVQMQLARQLWDAKTPADSDKIIELAEKELGRLEWRPVGDIPNNRGTIGMASNPSLALVERLTNAIDAMLELGHLRHPASMPNSPRQAARLWYGVPTEGLGEMTDQNARNLGEKIKLFFYDSGDARRATVCIQDEGLGQTPRRFPDTLLSLHGSNKLDKPWQMGTFGQGGSVTFAFAESSIVLSRRHPNYLEGADDEIGWTLVREVEQEGDKVASYQYLVLPDDNVPTLPVECMPDLAHGTRITHIAYDSPLKSNFNTWQFFNSSLFDPVLPFWMSYLPAGLNGSRIIKGNAARLNYPDKASGDVGFAHYESASYPLGAEYGTITYNYWVLTHPTQKKAADSYVASDSVVSMTLFGQRQDAESRSWIRDGLKLPYIEGDIVVHIDADALTTHAKGKLFASTRERAVDGAIRKMIYDHLKELLRTDDELARLNRQKREDTLRSGSHKVSEKIRERLAKFIKTKSKQTRRGSSGQEEGTGDIKRQTHGSSPTPRNTDDSHLLSTPTDIHFSRTRLRIQQGGKSHVWLEINAKNRYQERNEDLFTEQWNPPSLGVRRTLRSTLLGGKSRWHFEADADATIGMHEFSVTLLDAGRRLTASLEVEVVKAQEAKSRPSKGLEHLPGPNIDWVEKEQWEDHGFDEHSVGKVNEMSDSTDILLNLDYEKLHKALHAKNLTPGTIERRQDRYFTPVAAALWMQEQARKNANPEPSEEYRKGEAERFAEAVLMTIEYEENEAESSS